MGLGLDKVDTILCLGAHPDDIDIGCAGAVARLVTAFPAAHVTWVVFSGSDERAAEARRAAAGLLPAATRYEVIVKSFRDSYFPYMGGEIKDYVHSLAAGLSPDVIFTHRREDLHQDHRQVAELTWNAFRQHLILEYEIPKYDGDLGVPNLYVPLSEQEATRKVNTIVESFPSQHSKQWFSASTFWSLLRIRGIESQSESGLAEAFFCRKVTLEFGRCPKC